MARALQSTNSTVNHVSAMDESELVLLTFLPHVPDRLIVPSYSESLSRGTKLRFRVKPRYRIPCLECKEGARR